MNAQVTHTPGPWHVTDNYIREDGGDWIVAKVIDGGHVDDSVQLIESREMKANANLIAAAPYMYDALVHIRDSVHLAGYFRDVAADAIAKATGEKP